MYLEAIHIESSTCMKYSLLKKRSNVACPTSCHASSLHFKQNMNYLPSVVFIPVQSIHLPYIDFRCSVLIWICTKMSSTLTGTITTVIYNKSGKIKYTGSWNLPQINITIHMPVAG